MIQTANALLIAAASAHETKKQLASAFEVRLPLSFFACLFLIESDLLQGLFLLDDPCRDPDVARPLLDVPA